MYTKLLLVFLLTVAYAYSQETGGKLCECDTQDIIERRDQLTKMFRDNPNEIVHPGTMVDLGCSHCEKKRRKRKIFPKVRSEEGPVVGLGDDAWDTIQKNRQRFGSGSCPAEYVRVAGICVPLRILEDVDY